MKLFKHLLPLAIVLSLGTAVSRAEDTPMEKEMSAMNKAYKALKKQIEDPSKKAENLALLAEIKKTSEASAKLEPKTAADQGAQKAAYLEKFRAQMADYVKAVASVETAVNAGDTAGAKAAFDKLNDLKKKGHEDFKKD